MTSKPKHSWLPGLFRKRLPPTRQRSISDPSPPTSSGSHNNPVPPNTISTRSTQTPDSRTGTPPRKTDSQAQESYSAVEVLRTALEGLRTSLGVFPPLKLAVGGLLDCMRGLEISEINRQAYNDVLTNLANLAAQLQAHISESKPTYMPYSINNVARSIEDQTRRIQARRDRSRARQFATAEEDCEEVLAAYRQLGMLFKRLQMDISLSIWDIVRKQYVDTRLKDLAAADDAYYNSGLTATMNKRHGCTPGTRTKILEDTKDWTRQDDGPKIYWMNGMAGTGKTTIAYSLCKRLEVDRQLGASFFCSRYSPTCRDVNKLMPTIAYQLGQYSSPYREALCQVLDSNPDIAKRDIETQFEHLIVQPLASIREAIPADLVVVIDALDECADTGGTKQVLGLLFQHAANLPVKFLVTSRPEPAIASTIALQKSGSHSTIHLHDIEESFVQADIRTYLADALATLQPSTEQIEILTSRAGRLFIFAATVVRYISPDDDAVDHGRRLSVMLSVTSAPGARVEGYEDLDGLYLKILAKALEEGRTNQSETEMKQQVLRTVICARETLDTSTLAQVLGVGDKKRVELAIKPLQSVLHLSQVTGTVSTLHASFPDFLLNEKRSEQFYCNQATHSAFLATRSFQAMMKSLRFNICGLESSFQPDKAIPDLQPRVDKAISPGLFYSCRYWSDHLLMATASTDLILLFEDFLTHRLLFWVEVLSLKRCIERGEVMLGQVHSWIPMDATMLANFTYDARNFVTTFAANPTSRSTPHIYVSTLPFTPKQSLVRTTYWPRTQGLIRVEGAAMEKRGMSALATWAVGGEVNSIAQSSDGKRIVSGSGTKQVSIWDASSGACVVGPLDGHEKEVWSVTFSPDDTHVASGSLDHSIRIWDACNGDLIAGPLCGHTDRVRSIAFSPDGARLASGSDDHTIRIWDVRIGAAIGDPYEDHEDVVWSVVFSPDGKHLASGSENCTILVLNWQTRVNAQGPLKGHLGPVRTIAYSPDGLYLASGSEDCTVRVWDMLSGVFLAGPFTGHTRTVSSVSFSPNGAQIVSGSWDRTVRVWDATSGNMIAGPFEGHRNDVNTVLFTANGTRILSGSDDSTIRVWDARHRTTSATESPGHTGGILSVAWSPDGTRAASGSRDNIIYVWDTHNGALVAGPFEGHTHSISSVAFSSDGARIVSGSHDNTIRTWDASTGALLVGPIEEHTGWVRSVAFSPDGSQIASGSGDRTIGLWHSHNGSSVVKPLEGHTGAVASIAFSLDGTRIVSGSWDRTVRMWDANDGAALWTSSAHINDIHCVAFSPDGTRVASGSEDKTILVLDASDGTALHGSFTGHTWEVTSVAFSPDGKYVVSGSRDRTVRVWDAESGTMVAGPLNGHTERVTSVAFSPDGARIVSGSTDRTIRFWDIAATTRLGAASFHSLSIRSDGWMTNSNSELLLWVPLDVRQLFRVPSLSSSLVIGDSYTIHGDHSTLLLGDRWAQCFDVLPLSSP